MEKYLNEKNFNIIMTTAVLLILVIPVGIANIYLGFFKGENPCLLCGHERFGMVVVGVMGLFILRFGPKIKYIATVFITAFWFIFEATVHTSYHSSKDIGMGFGEAMFGMHTYTWAFVVYWVVILAMALMMFFIRPENKLGQEISSSKFEIKKLNKYAKYTGYLALIVVLSNVFQFAISIGLPPYGGTGNTTRFTLDIPKAVKNWDGHHWYENFIGGRSSFLGVNQGPKPYVMGVNEDKNIKFDTNYANLPFRGGEKLTLIAEKKLGFKAINGFEDGIATGIAYEPVNDEFAIIGSGGAAYFTDENFQISKEYAALDNVNGYDIPLTVAATFLAPNQILGTAYNKTVWGIQRVDPKEIAKDENFQWKFLRKVKGNLLAMYNGRKKSIMTTRAKRAYVLSLAKDPNSSFAYMMSIPVEFAPNPILLKYDTRDNQISEEAILEFSPELDGLKKDAKTSEFYITGMAFYKDYLLAISKNFNCLLVINPAKKQIEKAYELPEIGDFSDLAVRGENLYILSKNKKQEYIYVVLAPSEL